MTRTPLTTAATALLLGVVLNGAMAQNDTAAGSGPSVRTTVPERAPLSASAQAAASKLNRSDREFMEKAAKAGLYEVEIAKLAEGKASSDAVKRFASMMVGDQTQANAQLQKIAADNGVSLPTSLGKSKRRELDTMAKLDGEKFDRKFAHEVGMDGHSEDVEAFEKASRNVKLAQLKAWVDKTLPTLRAQLAAAAKLPQNANR
jgi:putative membrane protein